MNTILHPDRPAAKTTRRSLAWLCGPLLALLPATLAAYADGPRAASTGGFGETTCHSCHFDSQLDEPAGRLALAGLPERYEAGARYRLEVELTRPGAVRGGFQLAVRQSEGSPAGAQAGELTAPDARSQIVAGGERGTVQYAEQTQAGSQPDASGKLRWSVDWQAPDAGGPVVLHLAANAANGDDSPLGDFVYLHQARSTSAQR